MTTTTETKPKPADHANEGTWRVTAREVTDDRRRKRYYRTVLLRAVFPPEPWGERFRTYPRPDDVTVRFEGPDGPTVVDADVYRTRDETAQWWAFRLHADRPSEIIAEDQAEEWGRKLLPALKEAWTAARETCILAKARAERAREATHLCEWASGVALKRAKKACRYEQRLAALEAELAAEFREQATEVSEEEWTGDMDFHEDSIAYARQHLHEWYRGGRSGPFPRTAREVTPADMYGDADD